MLTDFQKNFLLTHYEADGCKFCCDTLNLQYKKIVYEAKKLNLFVNRTLLNKRISETKLKQSKNRTYSQYSVDPTNFISIKNKEISYILGLLWADGSIQEKTKKIQIEITTTDANEIIGLFKQTGNWCFYVRQRTDYKTQTTISTTNQILYSFLFNHGYKEKSIISPCSILNQIPNNLKHHFYRGILDGDGNIYQNPKTKGFVQVTISGSYIQDWKYMINLCDELLIKYNINRTSRINKKTGNLNQSSAFRLTGKRNILKFLNYVYQNYDNIGFSRKYNMYLTILGV